MRKTFKKYFVPHEHNEYKPHFFRDASLGALLLVIVFVFFGAVGTRFVINNTDMLGAVLPNVLIDLTNKDRTTEQLAKLIHDPVLEKAAALKAKDMVEKGYFAHTSPEGITPWYWLKEAGYNFAYAGENLAVNFSDSEEVDKAWMNSPLHRANILNKNYTHVGIAMAQGTYKGKETVFVVQMFGQPKTTAVVAEAPEEKPVVSTKVETPEVITESTTTTDVLGAEAQFIEFKDPEVAPVVAEEAPTYAPASVKVLSNPTKLLNSMYLLIAVIVIGALLVLVGTHRKLHHPHLVISALIVLFILLAFYFLYHTSLPSVIVN